MIGVESTPQSLRVTLRGRILFEHSVARPFLELGEGIPHVQMHYSNFKIAEKVRHSIVASTWTMLPSPAANEVLFDFHGICRMRLSCQDDGALFIEISGVPKRYNRLRISFVASKDEHVYGCGEQFTHLDMRGKKVPIWVQEQGVGRGKDLITLLANIHSGSGGNWHTTYFAQPTFVTSGGLSCHVDATFYQELDFRSPDRHSIYVWGIPTTIRLDVGNIDALVSRLSAYLGRQPELPSWSHDGLWLGVQGGRDVVANKLQRAREAGIPVAAIWAQDWEGIRMTSFGKQLFWNYRYDPILYPELPAYIDQLREEGVRFLGYINPMLVPEGDLYQTGKTNGYLVKDANGDVMHVKITTFPAGLVDFDNPDARRWYKSVIRENMLDIGMSGWMADFGEALPTDALLASGRQGIDAHNEYPSQWARVNREAVEEADKVGDVVFFMRAGYSGSSRHALAIWAGDQLVNWSFDDGFATIVPAGVSLGFCGIGHYHSDIGGYTTVAWIKRSKELLLRWCDQAVFSPIMRTHEGNRPGSNWQFDSDAETLAHFARMTRIFVLLGPYHREIGRHYVRAGLPPMRHPCLHDPADETLHSLRYQYLYGPDLMVAPVVKPGHKTWRVYLPKDSWIHLWTGRAYKSGWHEVPSPVGYPPVFYRESSEFRSLFDSLRKVH